MGNRNMMSAVFSQVRKKYKEVKNDWSRKRPGSHRGVSEHNLEGYQVYPYGDNFFSCMTPAVEMEFKDLAVNLETPVASLGSCFAEEFAYHMLSKGFNYIRTEKNRGSSANWGRVYTIPNLKQIVDYSIDPAYPVIVQKTGSRSNKQEAPGWFDPLRDRSPLHPDAETAKAEIQKHREASLEVFRKARVLVITLGQNEGWRDETTGLVWAQRPPSDILEAKPQRFTFETFKQPDIFAAMSDVLEKLFHLNPGLKVILSVSPVPAYATFHEKPVVPGSFANKCLLRVMAEDIKNNEKFKQKVYYFPSFEMVLAYNPFSYRADNRHVMPRSLKHIFKALDKGLKI